MLPGCGSARRTGDRDQLFCRQVAHLQFGYSAIKPAAKLFPFERYAHQQLETVGPARILFVTVLTRKPNNLQFRFAVQKSVGGNAVVRSAVRAPISSNPFGIASALRAIRKLSLSVRKSCGFGSQPEAGFAARNTTTYRSGACQHFGTLGRGGDNARSRLLSCNADDRSVWTGELGGKVRAVCSTTF